VGPEAAWASAERAGCNYLRMATADGSPVAPAAPLVGVTDDALERLALDVADARKNADVVIVALHKGIVHTPAVLASYERPLAAAAVDAGADIVVGHHAHLLRGIELRGGRPVFHGLGNACVVTHALSPGQDHPARAAWVERRRKLFGFEPDPRYTLAPFHPEAVHGALGIVIAHADGRLSYGVVPLWVEPPGRPACVDDERAEAVIAYLERITAEAGLPALTWRRVLCAMDVRMTWKRLRDGLVWIAGGALLAAVAVDSLAMIGRQIRIPLLGSIEIVEAVVLFAAGGGLIIATLDGAHARVNLLLERLPKDWRRRV